MNYLEMSDEDFLKAPPPSFEEDTTETEETSEVEQDPTTEVETEEVVQNEEEQAPATEEEEVSSTPDSTSEQSNQEDTVVSSEEDKVESNTEAEVDYKALYETLMQPIKATGKMIEIRSPEEAKQLMQMGADYTRKMQELAPYRKTLHLLKKANLIDESEIGFLIDLHQKNPQAIQKLLHDSNLDPLEIDTSAEPQYQGSNHRVSDEEVRFAQVVDSLATTDTGKVLLNQVRHTWDQASLDEAFKQPEILNAIYSQMENKIYDQIVSEVQRLTDIGKIPVGTPFLQSYNAVGQMLADQGRLNTQSPTPPPVHQPAAPIARRVPTPKPPVSNDARAKAAAASPNASQSKHTQEPNWLAMSDEEFEAHHKKFMNRM